MIVGLFFFIVCEVFCVFWLFFFLGGGGGYFFLMHMSNIWIFVIVFLLLCRRCLWLQGWESSSMWQNADTVQL